MATSGMFQRWKLRMRSSSFKSTDRSQVASEYDCNVCVLSLADPDLKDDGLRQAMQRVPKRSCICFEDVDALFDNHRDKRQGGCLVTFSGLLNALDGVGDPRGTIFFLTTNYKDRLDKALIRPGRVDVQVALTPTPALSVTVRYCPLLVVTRLLLVCYR